MKPLPFISTVHVLSLKTLFVDVHVHVYSLVKYHFLSYWDDIYAVLLFVLAQSKFSIP